MPIDLNIWELATKQAIRDYNEKVTMEIILDYAIKIRKWIDKNSRNLKYIEYILFGNLSPQLKYKHSLKKPNIIEKVDF